MTYCIYQVWLITRDTISICSDSVRNHKMSKMRLLQMVNSKNTTRFVFYRATHTHSAVYAMVHCQSVCLSVTNVIVLKRLDAL